MSNSWTLEKEARAHKGGAGGKNTGNDNEKLMNINKGEERTQEMMMKNLWSSNREN